MAVATAQEDAEAQPWAVLALFLAIYICLQYDRAIVSVIQEPVKREFGLSDSEMGILSGLAHGGAFAISGLPMGMLIDRLNRRNLLATITCLWSIATGLCALATGFWSFLGLRMLVGGSEAGGYPAMLSLTTDIFPQARRTTAIGILTAGSSLAIVLTLLIGAPIVQAYGWRVALLGAGVFGVLLALVLLTRTEEPHRATHGGPESGGAYSLKAVARFAVSQPALLLCMSGCFLGSTVLGGFWAWILSFMIRVHGLSIHDGGVYLALTAGLGSATGVAGNGILSDFVGKHDPRRRLYHVSIACLICVPIGLSAIFAETRTAALTLLLFFALFAGAYTSIGTTMVLTLTKQRMRGTIASILSILNNFVGVGSGALLVGVLSDVHGGPTSLRFALTVLILIYVFPATLFFAATCTLRANLLNASE